MLVSVDDNTFVDKNREYFSDGRSVAHLPKANRGPMTKGLRISIAINVFFLKLAPGAFEIKRVTLVFNPLKYAPLPFVLVFLRLFFQPISTVLCF